ncbi:unnamed protein product, partial [Prorocentrum cordatum]
PHPSNPRPWGKPKDIDTGTPRTSPGLRSDENLEANPAVVTRASQEAPKMRKRGNRTSIDACSSYESLNRRSGSCAGTCSSARARRVCRRTAQAGTGTAASPSAGAGPSRASPSGRRSREGRLARRRQFQHIHSQSSWGGGTAPRGRTPGRRRARARGWATAPPGPRRRRPRGASAPCSEQELLPVREALRLPEREPADGSPATSSACSSGHSRASSQGLPASWPPPPPGDRHRGARRAEEVARQQARHGPQEHGVRRGLLQGVVLHPQGPKLRGHAAELDEPHLREPVACEVAALEVVREDNSTRAPRSMRPPCSTSTSPVSIARSGRAGSRASPCVDAASPRARTSWSTRSPIENRPRGQPKCPRSPSCP